MPDQAGMSNPMVKSAVIGTILQLVDVPLSTVAVGTGSTAVAGIVGGLIGKVLGGRSAS